MKKQFDLNNLNNQHKLNIVDSKSRNKKTIVLDAKDKSNTLFTISTKDDLLNPEIDRGTSLFLNETIKLDEGMKYERKKKKLISHFETLKKNFFENYYSRNKSNNNGKEKQEIRVKSPKDNKNSPFKRKNEIVKRLNLENQMIKEKILKEQRDKAYLNFNSDEKLKIMNTTIFTSDQPSKMESSISFKTNLIEKSNIDRKNSIKLMENLKKTQSSYYQKIDDDVINKERYYWNLKLIKEDVNLRTSQYSLFELFDTNKQNTQTTSNKTLRNTSQIEPKGLFFGKNSNEFYKYTIFDQETESNKSNKIKNDTEKRTTDVEHYNTNQINRIKPISNNTSILSPRRMELIHEAKEFKRKIVDDFVDNIKPEKFRSDQFRHRRIYVILNGTVVLNIKSVSGKFIDVPTAKFFMGLGSKKERILFFHKFIENCIDVFALTNKIKNVYLANGHTIFDLMEIPEQDKYIYISLNEIFVGINIMNYTKQKKQVILSRNKNLESEANETNNNNKVIIANDYFKNYAKENEDKITSIKMKNKLNIYKKIRRLNSIYNYNIDNLEKQRNHSFDIGYYERKNLDQEMKKDIFYKLEHHENSDKNQEENYHSETENKKKNAWDFITCNFPDSFKLFLHYYDFMSSNIWIFLKKRVAERIKNHPKNKYINRNLDRDLIGNVDKFNENIRKKIYSLNNFMEKKKRLRKKKQEESQKKDTPDEITRKLKETMQTETVKLMKRFLKNLNLFKTKDQNYNDYFINQEYGRYKHLPHVQKNIDKNKNVYYFMDKYVNSVLPTLFDFNIPKLLKKYKNFTREELYVLYTQYKVLMKICIATNKNPLVVKKGIDFKSFHKGVLQMSNESEDLANKIFSTINESKTKYLSLDEFLKGMSIIKSQNITDKIDMFFKIIDTDGNGRLSWDEVFDISIMSLKRSLVTDDESSEKLVEDLAKYFADLIFNMVDVDIEEEIPLPKIKEKIIAGGEEGTYLEMFCCADNFKKSGEDV